MSSALHGLICADSLGIPNQHIILGEKVVGGEYKFKDYYSVFKKVIYHPIFLQETILTEVDIQNLTHQYAVSPEEVEAICQRLIQAFSAMKEFWEK